MIKKIFILFVFFPMLLYPANQTASNAEKQVKTITTNDVSEKANVTMTAPKTNITNSNNKKQKALRDASAPPVFAKASTGTQDDREDKKETEIYLNFENATLSSVVSYVTEQLKKSYVPNKDLDGIQVSLSTQKPLTPERTWNILLTLLDVNGFTITEVNNLYRIVPNQQSQMEPLPVYSSGKGIEPKDLPDNDTTIRYVYFLKNLNVETAANILDSMLDPNSTKINKDLEALIITEKSYNIKSSMKIVKILDEGGSKQTLKLVPLKHIDPETITKIFSEIIPGQEQPKGNIRFIADINKQQSAYFSPNTKIFPLARKNVLILMGREENLNKIIEFIHKYLDVPLGDAKSRIHIKEIQYANAEKLKPILENIIRPPGGQAAGKVLVGEYKFFEDVIITAESSQGAGEEVRGKGNRLIVACNQDDWVRIDKFINKLDKPQPQIALEVMIVDIGINQQKSLEAELRTKVRENKELGFELGKGIWGQTFNLTAEENLNTYLADKGSTNEYINQVGFPSFLTAKNGTADKNDIWAIIKTKLNIDNSNIIAQPFLVVNNYQTCNLNDTVSKRVTGRILQTQNYSGDPTIETVDFEAKTIIDITPYINLNGTVDLKIDITVDDFVGTSREDTTNRHLITRSTMKMGEVLVLGGLTRSSLIETEKKTPIFGDIPIVGNLFKSKSRTRDEKNLYIFIRPSVIKPQIDGGPDEYTQLKLDYAKYQILNVDTYYKEKDPIQRWFFRPTNQKIKAKLADAAKGVFRPIDNYTYGKNQPKSVNIQQDPYYRSSEEIEKQRQKLKKRETKIQSPDIRNYLKRRQKTL